MLGNCLLLKSSADFRFGGPECLLNVFCAVFLCLLKLSIFCLLSLIYTLPVPCAVVCPWKLKRPAQHSLVTLLSLLCAYPKETLVKTTENVSRSHTYRQKPPVLSVVGNLTSEEKVLFFNWGFWAHHRWTKDVK